MHEGQYVQVSCTISEGDLPLDIKWKLNEEDISRFPEITVSNLGKRSSVLIIENVSHLLAGNYTCVARNDAGTSRYSTELLVNGQIFSFQVIVVF